LYEAIEECAPGAWSSAGAAHVSIFSGLFGVLSPSDVIPDHRLAMGVSLPDLGVLSTWWAPRLDEAMSPEASERIIVDGRSGPYRAACKAPWARVWELRVERETDGKRSVISHDAKRWRGAITGLLLASDGYRAEETSAAENALEEAAYSLSLADAKGHEHRVTDVEYGPEKRTKKGGSTRTVTLVTH
ncbi:MAG: peroxide stress protein YaaA, partial [Schaalia odontolytica]